MTIPQWIVFAVVIAIAIYSYFEIAYSLNPGKQIKGMLGLVLLMFIVLISLFLVSVVIEANEKLSIENKAKCPEYVPIDNVFILKK